MRNRSLITAGILAALVGPVSASLPPQYQNADDLDVMVEFVKKHARVASTLKSIDMQNYIVRFGTDCKAEFERREIERPPGWVGAAAPLVLARISCKLE